jgi:hypothetical protein
MELSDSGRTRTQAEVQALSCYRLFTLVSAFRRTIKTAAAFEKRMMTRDQIIAELEKSFGFLKASMTAVPDAKLDAPLEVFGQKTTSRGLWISTTTHLHEHLGQLIAYARSNNVTPPWTK